jgi:flagellin
MALIIPPTASSTSIAPQIGPNSAPKTTGKTVRSVADNAAAPEQARAAQGDDLTISDAMRIQLRSLAAAERTVNEGIAIAQVADEALHQMGGLLEQMRDLASKGATSASSKSQGEATLEFSRLEAQVVKIQEGATYDGRPLLGTEAVEVGFDVVWEGGPSDPLALTLGGLEALRALAADPESGSIVGRIDDALAAIADKRARFATAVHRFAGATAAVQLARASRTTGTPPLDNAARAEELAKLCKAQIQGHGAAATLLQANQLPAHAMSLLQD